MPVCSNPHHHLTSLGNGPDAAPAHKSRFQILNADWPFGAVVGYLLLGIIWSLLYSAAETAFPGSFATPMLGGSDGVSGRVDRGTLGYFSFITLATVGYGDVTPTTPLAQTLAWTEAVTGQLYLAILVAGLVGFKVTQATKQCARDNRQSRPVRSAIRSRGRP